MTGGAVLAGRRAAAGIAAIATGGLVLRLWGLGQGYPDFYGHVDEIGVAASIWNFFRSGTLEPTEFTYPALYSYLVAGLVWLSGWWTGPALGSHRESLVLLSYLDPAQVALAGRVWSAAAGTLTLVVTFLLGRRAGGNGVGLAAASFLAVATVPVIQAHRALPDSTMAMFAGLCFLFSWRLYEHGRWWDYLAAGVAAGLVLASKYNGAFSALAIPAAHLLRVSRPGSRKTGSVAMQTARALVNTRLGAAVFVAFAALFAGSPYLILSSEKYLGVAAYQVSSLGFSMGQVQPWWWIVEGILVGERVIGGAMLAGLVLAVVRRRALDWLLVVVVLPSMLYIGSWTRESLHYLLHLYPLLAIAAAVAVLEVAERIRPGGLRLLLPVLVALPSLWSAIETGIRLGRIDSRSLAADWIEAQVPAGTSVGMTWLPYCPRLALFSERRSVWSYYGDDETARSILRDRWSRKPAYRLVNLETWASQPRVPEALAAVVDLSDAETAKIFRRGWRSPAQLRQAGVEYLVLPEAVYGRYLANSAGEAMESRPPGNAGEYLLRRNRAYFRELTTGADTEKVARFTPGLEIRGGVIHIFRLLPEP